MTTVWSYRMRNYVGIWKGVADVITDVSKKNQSEVDKLNLQINEIINKDKSPLRMDIMKKTPDQYTQFDKDVLSLNPELMSDIKQINFYKNKINSFNTIVPRAEWGPVKKDETYLVGENWPELFVPETSGNIKNPERESGIVAEKKWINAIQKWLQSQLQWSTNKQFLKQAYLQWLATKRGDTTAEVLKDIADVEAAWSTERAAARSAAQGQVADQWSKIAQDYVNLWNLREQERINKEAAKQSIEDQKDYYSFTKNIFKKK